MKYLAQMYRKRCKEELCLYNFKSYRNNQYRIVNDVFQSFELHQSVSGNQCTVHFVVVPLCVGETITKTYCGPDHLKMFDGDYSWFDFDRNEESIGICINHILGYIQNKLIPYFEVANNSYDAYYATRNFQEENYRGGIDWADYYLFCMALKAGLFNESLEHLNAIKKHTEYAYKRNIEHWGKPSFEYEQRIKDDIKKYEYLISAVSARDFEHINNFIVENEKVALSNLGILK